MADLYPLKFEPILKDKIWGGSRLKDVLNKPTKSDKCGESWEISGVQDNISKVSNGFLKGNSLQELVEVYMGDLVGDKVYEKFGLEFPLLIKFIDGNDNLSIQVHPDDKLSKVRHQAFGKTEMWYIVDADEGAELITGFSKDIDKETYLKHLGEKSLLQILNKEKVDPGDVFFIPAGRVHAIGPGILLAEIQQTSDVTYRIYDWDRVDEKGKSRELHTDLALDAIDYKCYPDYKTMYSVGKNGNVNLVECEYFTTNVLQFDQPVEKDFNLIDSFVIYMCTSGKASIVYNVTERITIEKGESLLVPASIKNIGIVPEENTRLLEVYIK